MGARFNPHDLKSALARAALVMGAIWIAASLAPADAGKRRPNGCDWIGGDFAEPGEVMFHTGCPAGGKRAGPAKVKDEPPKPLDRPDARAPANYGASTRKSMGKGIESFQVIGAFAYGIDGGGRLWRFGLADKASKLVAPAAVRFRATEAGSIFVLEKDGTLWRADPDGSNRAFIDHLVADFQPTRDALYILDTDKHLWRLRADGRGRDPVDDNVVAFQALDAKTIFVLGSDGALWRETGDMHDRAKVGQPVAYFEYVAEGDATYVLTPSHFLWRQKGLTGPPAQVDHDVAAFHAVDARLVYALALDGRLWQEPGDRTLATLVDGDLAVKLGPAAFQFASPGDVAGQAIYALDRKHELWAETMPSTKGPGG
jgi:hypothetical protein